MDEEVDVIVIGAGIAGLICARHLIETSASLKVVVLEAKDRIGGRINSESGAHFPIELGAEFIHGERVITWQELKRYKLRTVEDNSNGEYPAFSDDFPNDGFFLDGWDQIEKVVDKMYDDAEKWVRKNRPDAPVIDLFPRNLSPAMKKCLVHRLSPEYAANLQDLGIHGFVEQSYEGDGEQEDFRVKEGYSSLVIKIQQESNIDVRLNHEVKQVTNWKKQEDMDGDIIIETLDRSTPDNIVPRTFRAKHIVITVPLAILQSNDIRFTPPLPDNKLTAIHALRVGIVHKVILTFTEDPFPRQMMGLITDRKSELWWKTGMGQMNHRTTWIALVSGEHALEHNAMSDEEVVRSCIEDLAVGFARYLLLEQNIQSVNIHKLKSNRKFSTDEVNRAVDILTSKLLSSRVVRWSREEFIRMGYSYVPVNAVGMRAVLAESIENRLFFAGEATHTFRASTVHGAIETGLRAAKEVLVSFSK